MTNKMEHFVIVGTYLAKRNISHYARYFLN